MRCRVVLGCPLWLWYESQRVQPSVPTVEDIRLVRVRLFRSLLGERAGRCDVPVEFPEMVIKIHVTSQDLSGYSKISLAHPE